MTAKTHCAFHVALHGNEDSISRHSALYESLNSKPHHGDKELQAFTKASEQIQGFVAHYNVKAVSLAAVFDESDGFFWGKEVDFPVQNRVHWGREACVEPLAAALDEREPVGIVLLDKANLRVFTMSLGRIKERLQKEFDRKKLRHTKTIGMQAGDR